MIRNQFLVSLQQSSHVVLLLLMHRCDHVSHVLRSVAEHLEKHLFALPPHIEADIHYHLGYQMQYRSNVGRAENLALVLVHELL